MATACARLPTRSFRMDRRMTSTSAASHTATEEATFANAVNRAATSRRLIRKPPRRTTAKLPPREVARLTTAGKNAPSSIGKGGAYALDHPVRASVGMAGPVETEPTLSLVGMRATRRSFQTTVAIAATGLTTTSQATAARVMKSRVPSVTRSGRRNAMALRECASC